MASILNFNNRSLYSEDFKIFLSNEAPNKIRRIYLLKYCYVYNDALMAKIDLPFVPLSICTHCTCVLSPFLKSNLKKI